MSALLPLRLDEPTSYEISVQGWLDTVYSGWMGEATIDVSESENPVTRITVRVADQAELYGVLQALYSLGLPLLSLLHVSNSRTEEDASE